MPRYFNTGKSSRQIFTQSGNCLFCPPQQEMAHTGSAAIVPDPLHHIRSIEAVGLFPFAAHQPHYRHAIRTHVIKACNSFSICLIMQRTRKHMHIRMCRQYRLLCTECHFHKVLAGLLQICHHKGHSKNPHPCGFCFFLYHVGLRLPQPLLIVKAIRQIKRTVNINCIISVQKHYFP